MAIAAERTADAASRLRKPRVIRFRAFPLKPFSRGKRISPVTGPERIGMLVPVRNLGGTTEQGLRPMDAMGARAFLFGKNEPE